MTVPLVLPLDLTQILQGSFSLIFVSISIFVGLRILSKYFEFKRRQLALVGISWIGMAAPWLSDAINFIMILTFSNVLTEEAYIIIAFVFIPAFVIAWLIAFTDFLYKSKQKIIILIYLIWTVIYEVVFFTLMAIDITQIGEFLGPFQVEFGDFINISLFSFIIVVLITGLMFARESLKSNETEIKLKGKFLIAAFISFTVGAIIDSIISPTPFGVVIARIILISSAIEFYLGFILPKWLKNFLIRES